jgi:hypothetical protein
LIYPNPSNDFIQLNVKGSNINETFLLEIFDNTGKKMASTSTQNDKRIPISFLENGIYTIVVKTKQGEARGVFCVMK